MQTDGPRNIEQDALSRALFDAGPDAVLVVGRDGRISHANSRTAVLFDYSPEELIGQPLEVLIPERFREAYARQYEKFRADPRGMTASGLRIPGRRRDGSEFPAAVRLSPQSSRGGVFVAVVVADISELRRAQSLLEESEDRYRRLIDLSPDMYAILSDDKLRFINPAGLRLLGASDKAEALGRNLFDFVAPEFHDTVRSALPAEEAASGMPSMEVRLQRLDGSTIDVEVAAIRSTFEGSAATQVVVRDISERKRAEEMQVRARAAEAADQLKSVLLNTVSHELRTPLTAVRGYASALIEYFDRLEPAEIKQHLEGIDAAAQHLERMVSDLLALSRRERAAMRRLDRTPTQLVEFLRASLSSHRVATPGIDFVLSVPKSDAGVYVDRSRLQQVIDNLIDNAVKHAGIDKPFDITVKAGKSHASVTIRDRGPGVPRESLKQVFAPFVRMENGGKRPQPGGTGLGLAVCRRIVVAHGGEIAARIPAGGGFEVTFTLPLHQSPGHA